MPRRAADLATGLVLWAAAVAVAVQTAVVDLRMPVSKRLPDLHVYLGAVRLLLHGGSLYDYTGPRQAPFLYPPSTAVVFAPLTWLSEQPVRVGWTVATVAVVFGGAVVVARRLPWPAARSWPWAASGAVALALVTSAPFRSNLVMGQVSVALTIATIVDALAFRSRRGQGVLVGIAGAAKLTPLLFVPFFWLTGQRRAALQASITFALCTGLSALVWPHDSWRYWTKEVVSSTRTQGLIGKGGNQSLLGMAAHTTRVGPGLRGAWLVAAVAVGALGLWQAVRRERVGDHLAAVVLCGLVTVVVSPLSWTHHQLWLVLLAAVALSPNVALQVAWCALVLLVTHPGGLPFQVLGHRGVADWLERNQRGVLALVAVTLLPSLLPRPGDLTDPSQVPHAALNSPAQGASTSTGRRARRLTAAPGADQGGT